MDKIAIFVLFLGPLVFFHELGHFLFARFFGVRVEVFSIGFGPKLLKFKRGDTEYAISLIPLGGYVKMFGDDPLNKDAIPESERKHSFTFKGKWARFWIVMGGPLANFIMAYVIFFTLLSTGERMPEMKIGVISNESPFAARGLKSGDRIKKVNGKNVFSPTDIIFEGDDLIKTMMIERLGRDVTVALNMTGKDFFEEFAKYPPTLRQPIVVDKNGNRFVVSAQAKKVDWDVSYDQFKHMWDPAQPLFLYPVVVDEKSEDDPFKVNFELEKSLALTAYKDLERALTENGFKNADLSISKIQPQSAAMEVGLKAKDVIISMNGNPVYSFDQLKNSLQKTTDASVELGIWRAGSLMNFKVTPKVKTIKGKVLKLIGVHSGGIFQPLKFIETSPKSFGDAFLLSFSRTWQTVVKTIEGFKKLITGEVSFKTIGGPITIGKVASDSFYTSFSYFFQLMALISVNLGVINLFPIPVLDGGHILFIILEVLNRGPVSRRKMEIAQQVGLSILLMLMVGALFNDVNRLF